MTDDIGPGDHREALGLLRGVVTRAVAAEITGADLVAAIDAHPAPTARDLARMYVFGARVGGAAATPERAAMWLRGWAGAASRTDAELQAALVDGIRFGERLHRALGIAADPSGDGGPEAA